MPRAGPPVLPGCFPPSWYVPFPPPRRRAHVVAPAAASPPGAPPSPPRASAARAAPAPPSLPCHQRPGYAHARGVKASRGGVRMRTCRGWPACACVAQHPRGEGRVRSAACACVLRHARGYWAPLLGGEWGCSMWRLGQSVKGRRRGEPLEYVGYEMEIF